MTEKTKQTSRRKGRGRNARLKDRANSSNSNAIWPGIEDGLCQPLAERDVGKVHQAALTIVEQTGIADATKELRDLVLPKGAFQNDYGRLCFPHALVEDVLASSASEYLVYARGSRAGRDDIHCKNNSVYFSNSGTAVTTFDAETKTYRPFTLQDIYDFTRLVDKLDNIHMLGDTVLATDVPNDYEHDVNMVYAILAASEKPACVTFRNRNNIRPAIRLFDLASGGMDRSPTDRWENEGSHDLFSRSRKSVNEILNSHYPNYFDEAVDAKIRQEFPIYLPKSQMGS